MELRDNFDRIIDYMRISITDRCNYRCVYCMPSHGVIPIEHKEILTYEEITSVAGIAVTLGVRKIRITGGEPLARKNVTYLISSLKRIHGIEDISLTTNGVLLERYAAELADAGLDRVNISLDSLRPERYRQITRGGEISRVLKGIEAAERAGLTPVKINMIPIRGLNEDEIEEFAKLTLHTPLQVRFIEYMPMGAGGFWDREKYISTDEIRTVVESVGSISPVKLRRNGPARYYRFENAPGVIGFISALTHHFCGDCNRIRITADGRLRPCLFAETEIDLKPALRPCPSDKEIERLLRLSIQAKPEQHAMNNTREIPGRRRPMSRIGG